MTTTKTHFVTALALTAALSAPGGAHAQSAPKPEAQSPYSIPWQLRPVTIGTSARLDGVVAAFNDTNGNFDVAVASSLSASYQITPEIAPILRLAYVHNNAPGAALDGDSFANPLLGASYGRCTGPFKWTLFGATTLPLGTGAGNDPNAKAARANVAAATARPTDAALFAVNYLTEIVGGDLAYVNHAFTAQAEATFQAQIRVRGAQNASALDAFRMNAALGLHFGYFIGSHFSLGSDLHYQRWLLHPTRRDAVTFANVPLSNREMDTTTLALGLRLHFQFGTHTTIHPGFSVMRGLDSRAFAAPLVTRETTAVQLDLPVEF